MSYNIRCKKIRQVAYHKFRCIFSLNHTMPHVFQVYLTIVQPLEDKKSELIDSYPIIKDVEA